MQSYGSGFEEAVHTGADSLNVDEAAWRAIRPFEAEAAGSGPGGLAKPKPNIGQRLSELVRGVRYWLMSWLPNTVAFFVVLLVSLAAVSFALDPDHVLDDVAVARGRAGITRFFSNFATNLGEAKRELLPGS